MYAYSINIFLRQIKKGLLYTICLLELGIEGFLFFCFFAFFVLFVLFLINTI